MYKFINFPSGHLAAFVNSLIIVAFEFGVITPSKVFGWFWVALTVFWIVMLFAQWRLNTRKSQLQDDTFKLLDEVLGLIKPKGRVYEPHHF